MSWLVAVCGSTSSIGCFAFTSAATPPDTPQPTRVRKLTRCTTMAAIRRFEYLDWCLLLCLGRLEVEVVSRTTRRLGGGVAGGWGRAIEAGRRRSWTSAPSSPTQSTLTRVYTIVLWSDGEMQSCSHQRAAVPTEAQRYKFCLGRVYSRETTNLPAMYLVKIPAGLSQDGLKSQRSSPLAEPRLAPRTAMLGSCSCLERNVPW